MFSVTSNAIFLLTLLTVGCVSMEQPEGFLITEDGGSEIKAVSSDDTLLWVRIFGDDYDGNLAFWSEAIYNDFVDNRGYTLVEKNTIQLVDPEKLEGEEMLFEAVAAGELHRYLVSLFVKDKLFSRKICIVEFVGRGDAFTEKLEAVRSAIRTLSF